MRFRRRRDDPRLFVGSQDWQRENAERHGDELSKLADVLLAIGGEQVVVPPDRPDLVASLLEAMSDRGRQFDTKAALVELGEASECHANVAALWRVGRGTACSGFALSADGLWRSHSWLVAREGQLIETTEQRVGYFGVELDDRDAESFATTANG